MSDKQYERSTKGLRDMLFDAIHDVKAGRMKPSEAVQLSSVARQIIATADFELRVQRQAKELQTSDADAIRLAPPVVKLGNDQAEDGDR